MTTDILLETVQKLEARVQQLETHVKQISRVVQFDEDGKTAAVFCQTIHIHNGYINSESGSMWLTCDEEGVALTINDGKSARVRLALDADENNNDAHLAFYGDPDEPTVLIGSHENGGHVAVFNRAGTPRALLKGSADFGAVSVTGDDGIPLALLRSDDGFGVVETLSADRETMALLRATDNGGLVRVSSPDKERNAFLLATNDSQMLMLGDIEDGTMVCHSNVGSGLRARSEHGEMGAMLNSHGGEIHIKNKQNHTVARLGTLVETGTLQLGGTDGDTRVMFSNLENHTYMRLGSTQGASLSVVAKSDEVGLIMGNGAERAAVDLRATSKAVHLMLGSDDGESAVHVEVKNEPDSERRAGVAIRDDQRVVSLATSGEKSLLAMVQGEETIAGLVCSDEDTQFQMCAPDGLLAAHIFTTPGGAMLKIKGETGSDRVAIGVTEDAGQALFSMSGGDPALITGASKDGGHVVFYNDDGEPHIILPDELDL